MSASAIVGPPLMNNLFAYFTQPDGDIYFPGAAMLLGFLFMIISAILARGTLKKNLPQPKAATSPGP
jgi:DHA1 family tetracycline resistance protein-like MFS transporter